MDDYKKDLSIEPDALDIEWLEQPRLYMKWAEMSAKADDRAKLSKEALEVTDAKIDNEIRSSGEKVTENQIKARIASDERHQKALQDYNDALYKSNLYSSAVKAMEHRKAALENMVRLMIGQYFAGPKDPRDLKREYIKAMEERDKARGI